MSADTLVRKESATDAPQAQAVDMKFEIDGRHRRLPISARQALLRGHRAWKNSTPSSLQATTTGSSSSRRRVPGCTIIFGKNVTSADSRLRPGVVPDRLRRRGRPQRSCCARGIEVSDVFHSDMPRASTAAPTSPACSAWMSGGRLGSRPPQLTARLPRSTIRTAIAGCSRRSPPDCRAGSTATTTSFSSDTDLAAAMRRASIAHGEHEKRTGGQRDENLRRRGTPHTWPRSEAGKELPL